MCLLCDRQVRTYNMCLYSALRCERGRVWRWIGEAQRAPLFVAAVYTPGFLHSRLKYVCIKIHCGRGPHSQFWQICVGRLGEKKSLTASSRMNINLIVHFRCSLITLGWKFCWSHSKKERKKKKKKKKGSFGVYLTAVWPRVNDKHSTDTRQRRDVRVCLSTWRCGA